MKMGSMLGLLQIVCLLGTVLFFASSCATTADSNDTKIKISPRLSENEIRDRLLKYTPVGSSLEEVREFAQIRLKHIGDPNEDGPATRRRRPGPDEDVGVRSVNVCLGEYGFPGRTGTFISWSFDKNDKLVDVIVQKWRDSL